MILLSLILSLLTLSQASEIDAFTALRRNTVKIESGTASTIQFNNKNYLLTNWHVCLNQPYNDVSGQKEDGSVVSGYILKFDTNKDLCAIKIASGVPFPLTVSNHLSTIETIYTRGYPDNRLRESSGRIKGTYSYKFEFKEGLVKEFFNNLTTLYAVPGSSGSPVVNDKGELVGVIQSYLKDSPNSAGMVTLEDLRSFLNTL